jgi:hypothetical protein
MDRREESESIFNKDSNSSSRSIGTQQHHARRCGCLPHHKDTIIGMHLARHQRKPAPPVGAGEDMIQYMQQNTSR